MLKAGLFCWPAANNPAKAITKSKAVIASMVKINPFFIFFSKLKSLLLPAPLNCSLHFRFCTASIFVLLNFQLNCHKKTQFVFQNKYSLHFSECFLQTAGLLR